MKYKKALETAKGCIEGYLSKDFYHTVAEALEKQILKPLDYTDDYCDTAICPICGFEFENGTPTWKYNYCPECGQAIDWEED